MAKSTRHWVLGGVGLLAFFSVAAALPYFLESSYYADLARAGAANGTAPAEVRPVYHIPTPASVKALYMTACVSGTSSWRSELKSVIETTELNAVVIDIKDSTGTISYPTALENGGAGCRVKDLQNYIMALHDSGIYVIGRISVFQDPVYAKAHPELAVKSFATGGVWKDRKGLSFVDVGAKPYWERVVAISKGAYEIGFDEINFDYVRYPSDGDMSDANYTWTTGSTKAAMLEEFFSYLYDNLKTPYPKGQGPVISADLFGMTTTVPNDMGIGQVLENALPYFDYIAPMVYPSHYPATWQGFDNPAAFPYEVVKIAMTRGREREVAMNVARGLATSTPSKLRPWLQDFNLGAFYGPDKVEAQIKATYDSGLASWMIWDAGNTYTVAALKPETGFLKAGQ